MSCWFSCCYGSRKELPKDETSIQPVVGSVVPKSTPQMVVKRLDRETYLGDTILPTEPNKLLSYTSGYQSMERRSVIHRQTTEPIIKISSVPSSAQIILPVSTDAPSTAPLMRTNTTRVLYEVSPLQRSSSEASEPPPLARSFSVVSQLDPEIGILQKQILSLERELETFSEKNISLQKEADLSKELMEKELQKSQTLELELEGSQKENIKWLQRNSQLEKRLAEAREKVLQSDKNALLQSPLDGRMERRGSMSDIEEEEGDKSTGSDTTPTLLQVQQELEKMRSRYQRVVRHHREVKGTVEHLKRENNRLEMQLQEQIDKTKDQELILEKMEKNLEKREGGKSEVEKREVAVEEAEERQEQAQVNQKELEQQLRDQEQFIEKLREQLKELHTQRNEGLKKVEQLTQDFQGQNEKIRELEKCIEAQEHLVLGEREKNKFHRQEMEKLQKQLTEATTLLAGYEVPAASGSGMKRSSSLPTRISTT